MIKRELVKWQPFNAVIPSHYMIQNVLKNKNKIIKPILSEDQLNNLEKKIIEAYTLQDEITIKIYQNGHFFYQKGKITNIDQINHKLFLNNHRHLYFAQIIEIF